MLVLDKSRPRRFEDLSIHHDIGQRLQKVLRAGDCPNILLYGPCGKRTMLSCILGELYGDRAFDTILEDRTIKTDKKEVEIRVKKSDVHIEIDLSDVLLQDKKIVGQLIRSYVDTRDFVNFDVSCGCKTVVLLEANRISAEGQSGLKVVLETLKFARFVLVSKQDNLNSALCSRCYRVRLPKPTSTEVLSLLKSLYLSGFTATQLQDLSQETDLHILQFKLCAKENKVDVKFDKVGEYERRLDEVVNQLLNPTQVGPFSMYNKPTENTVKSKVQPQPLRKSWNTSTNDRPPGTLLPMSDQLEMMLIHGIPPNCILQGLVNRLLPKVDKELHVLLYELAANVENRFQDSFVHIEHFRFFCASFMYKHGQFLSSLVI